MLGRPNRSGAMKSWRNKLVLLTWVPLSEALTGKTDPSVTSDFPTATDGLATNFLRTSQATAMEQEALSSLKLRRTLALIVALTSIGIEIQAAMHPQDRMIRITLRLCHDDQLIFQDSAPMTLWLMRPIRGLEILPGKFLRFIQKRPASTYLDRPLTTMPIMSRSRVYPQISQCYHRNHQSQAILQNRPSILMREPHQCQKKVVMETLRSPGVLMRLAQNLSRLDHVKIMLFASLAVVSSLQWHIAQIVERNFAAIIGQNSGFIEISPTKDSKTASLMRRLIRGLRRK